MVVRAIGRGRRLIGAAQDRALVVAAGPVVGVVVGDGVIGRRGWGGSRKQRYVQEFG